MKYSTHAKEIKRTLVRRLLYRQYQRSSKARLERERQAVAEALEELTPAEVDEIQATGAADDADKGAA